MSSEESLETRVYELEAAIGAALAVIEANRRDIVATRVVLTALIDSFRPDEPAKAYEWLDAIEYVAVQNAALSIDLASDAIIRDHGVDPDMLDAMEDERKAVAQTIEQLFAALKNPKGGLTRD